MVMTKIEFITCLISSKLIKIRDAHKRSSSNKPTTFVNICFLKMKNNSILILICEIKCEEI